MPMYDRQCDNGHITLDYLEPIECESPICKECGASTSRVWLPGTRAIIDDDIPGGVLIHHGICNEDGTPRRYYSKSEIAKEAKRRGLHNHVEHVTAPGTDKSKHTTRWI